MSAVADDFSNKVKERVDIVEVISEYVDLKRSGKNYKGLCPFHQENTPSFTVNPDKQFYYCFGCHAGGDVYNFLMEIENITFRESMKLLARRAGLEIPGQSKEQKRINKTRERLFQINNLTARYYNYLLSKKDVGEKAREYLLNRGYTLQDIDDFYLGYAPDNWRALLNFLTGKGYDRRELIKAGLILKSDKGTYYDRFRNRIIFPIFNIRDEVLAFGARTLQTGELNTPKYINSPETLIYKKGTTLYGINWAREGMRETDEAMIMEGYTDVLTARKEGLENVIASLGTSLTDSQARLLKRYVSTVYIAYDADAAGTRATLRGLDILKKAGLNVKVIQLAGEEDPDDYLQQYGRKSFLKKKEQALNLPEYKLKQITDNKDLNNPEVKVDISRKIVEMLLAIADPVEREIYLQKAAERINIATDVLKEEMSTYNKKDKNYKNSYTKSINKTNISGSINILEDKILQALINNKKIRQRFADKIRPDYFSENREKVVKLIKDNIETDINILLQDIENEEIRKKIMEAAIKEDTDPDQAMVESWLNRLKESRKYQKKLDLFHKLSRKGKISLSELNELLLVFQQLNVNGKGGI